MEALNIRITMINGMGICVYNFTEMRSVREFNIMPDLLWPGLGMLLLAVWLSVSL